MPEVERKIKSTQEQAVASWINELNQARLDELAENLMQQNNNLENALLELSELKEFISDPEHILGSDLTKHGEIAEHMQVNISNARRAVEGLSKEYTFEGVGRTAPEDYIKDGQQVQSKFYNGLKQTLFNHHGLEEHRSTYEDFVKNGGSYDIPKDQYDKMVEILYKYRNSPSQLSTSDYMLAKKIDEFLKTNDLELGRDINAAVVKYSDSQVNVAEKTVDREEINIRDKDREKRQEAYDKSKPSLEEGVKAAELSAAFEGGITFCISFAKKRKEKNLRDFTSKDWKEIGIDTGKGAVKGGIRGAVIYQMTNFTQTPACVASALVTAAYGVAAQVKSLENGSVSQEDFVINCETVCLDVTVSAIASLVGQTVIPIPVLGAVIGNVAGEFIYDLCKKEGSRKADSIIEGYHKEINELNKELKEQYQKVIEEILEKFKEFSDIESLAFDEDVNKAFNASIQLAEYVGVENTRILKTKEQIDDFFLN